MSDDVFDLDDDWWDYDDVYDEDDVEPDRGLWWGVWGLGLEEYDDPEATGAPSVPVPHDLYVFPYLDGPKEGHRDFAIPGRPDERMTPCPALWLQMESDGVWYYVYAWRGDGFRVSARYRPAFDQSSYEVVDDSPPSTDISGTLQRIVPNGLPLRTA